ncbi:CapA family protein [Bacillus sp. FSL K6-3431]|uniref:CapA family protein n=1 Tax=Bacillus sp. FSL K6-3431 TaxID=2921500 RepID=UPI0030F502B2
MQILIGGDLVPTQSNFSLFKQADVNSLLGEDLLTIWKNADLRLFNLEVPLVDKEGPIEKCGPNLIAPVNTINGIKALNPSLITLANNHILDQGELGLKSTKAILNEHSIPFVGAGEDLNKASKPYIINRNGFKIGVYACAENEFTIATENSSGANPFDPLESLDQIQRLSEMSDYVIVLYHGGKEHYRYPSPYLQKVCRKIASKGADLVICQHSHCVGCFENFQDSTIVYGQGNFVFDRSDSEFWKTSILVNLTLGNKIIIDYIPIIKKENVIRLAHGKDAEIILSQFKIRSSEICQEGFIEENYQEYADEKITGYLRQFSGLGKWLSRIDRKIFKGSLINFLYKRSNLLAIQNYIECEAHRELILKGLKGENKNAR